MKKNHTRLIVFVIFIIFLTSIKPTLIGIENNDNISSNKETDLGSNQWRSRNQF